MYKMIRISESAYEILKEYAEKHKRSLINELDILLNRIHDGVSTTMDDYEDDDEDGDDEEYTGGEGYTAEEERAYNEYVSKQEKQRREWEAKEKAFNLDKELEWWRGARESGELYDKNNRNRLSFLLEHVPDDSDDFMAIIEDINKIMK